MRTGTGKRKSNLKECQGNLVDIGLPKLLHLIYKQNDQVGVLDILREPIKKRFYFSDGIPVFATSNILGEVLGRLLMLEGIITQKDYEKSLEAVLKENRRHGEVLTSMGLITSAELNKFLYLQLKRRAWKIFGWNEGTYHYETIESLPSYATPMPLHPAKLILDGISLGFYPLERIRNDLDSYQDSVVVPSLDKTRYKIENFGLNIQETRFFEKFDGTTTVKEVLDGSFLLKQRALSLTLTLIMTGTLSRPNEEPIVEELNLVEEPEHSTSTAPATGSNLNAELLFMRAKSAFNDSNYKSAVETLKQIIEINPMEGEYWAWLGWALYNLDPSNIKEAEQTIKDAIDLNNELDGAWYFLARIFFEKEEYKAAETAYMTSCDKNPWMLEAVAELKRMELRHALYADTGKPDRPNYMETCGFSLDPFSYEPLDRFNITATGQKETLETTLSAIKKKEGPILIEARTGAGKSTLLIELLKSLSNKKTLAAAVLSPAKRELQLIRTINAELHASTESRSIKEQLLSLGMRVSQNNSQGGSTIIVLDNAEELTTGCLKLVQYLARLKSLQLILVGEPGISERLDQPEFAELGRKTLVRLNIAPLTLEETGDFFRKRISATNTIGTPLTIEQPALELLFKESEGIPGEIVRLSALLLSTAAHKGNMAIDRNLAAEAFSSTLQSDADSVNKEPSIPIETASLSGSVLTQEQEEELELVEIEPLENSNSDSMLITESKEVAPKITEKTEIEELGIEQVEAEELFVEVEEEEPAAPNHDLLEDVIKPTEKESSTDKNKEKIEEVPEPSISADDDETKTKQETTVTDDVKSVEEVKSTQKKKKPKKGVVRLVLIAILMILLGLAAGSLVNQYFFGP